MKKYCEDCGKEVETKVVTMRETYVVFGDSIEVDAEVLTCVECGLDLFCEELDNATLVHLYDEYRRRHNLPPTYEMKKIREEYYAKLKAEKNDKDSDS